MKILLSLSACCLIIMSSAYANNDYPTQARVEYVLQCMDTHGGQSYDTLYPCVCSFDKIAAKMSFEKYTDALTLQVMIDTPGEKGGAFRDAPGTRDLIEYFDETRQNAENSCFLKKKS